MALRWAFGEAMQGYEFLQQVGGPISLGVPLAGVWAYYGKWLKVQIQMDENIVRRAGKKRLYGYILSALGLGASFVGIALVLSFVIDLATSNAFWGGSLRPRLAGAISTLVVALPLWLLTWRPMQAEALSDGEIGEHTRRSNIRRAYLYLALFAGVIGGMASAVGLVYQLVNALLSGAPSANFLPEALNAAQLLVLFAVLLVYHLNCMRRDGAQTGQNSGGTKTQLPGVADRPGRRGFPKQDEIRSGKTRAGRAPGDKDTSGKRGNR